MTIVSILTTVRLLQDEELTAAMLAYASQLNPVQAPFTIVQEAATKVCVNPDKPPESCGYSLVEAPCVVAHVDETLKIKVTAKIWDPQLFEASALEAYQQAWGRKATQMDLSDCLFELVLGSNQAPAPQELGFEVVSTKPLD